MDREKYSGSDMQRKITLEVHNRKFKVQERSQNKTNDRDKQMKVAKLLTGANHTVDGRKK